MTNKADVKNQNNFPCSSLFQYADNVSLVDIFSLPCQDKLSVMKKSEHWTSLLFH